MPVPAPPSPPSASAMRHRRARWRSRRVDTRRRHGPPDIVAPQQHWSRHRQLGDAQDRRRTLDRQRKPLFADPAKDVADQIIVGESHPDRQRLPDGHPTKLGEVQQNFDARRQLRCDQRADPPDSVDFILGRVGCQQVSPHRVLHPADCRPRRRVGDEQVGFGLRLWDAGTGQPVGQPVTGNKNIVWSVRV